MSGATDACVFCGKPIRPDEPVAGRPPMAAHAACADAALADDTHWDAISGTDPDEPDDRSISAAGRAGCLGAALVILLAPALARRVSRR